MQIEPRPDINRDSHPKALRLAVKRLVRALRPSFVGGSCRIANAKEGYRPSFIPKDISGEIGFCLPMLTSPGIP